MPADKHLWQPSPLPGQVVLITTVDAEGRPGVATKSWISMAAFGPPPVLMFGCNLDHATARNALASGEYVVNVPGDDLVDACWAVGSDVSGEASERFERNGLTPIPAVRVHPPRIAECRAHLECEVAGVREWGREVAIFGRVVAVSADRAETADVVEQYRALAPFFFLQEGLAAPLGLPRRAGKAQAGPPGFPAPADDLAGVILALERAALDRWAQGDPSGFLEICAPDVVYFDPYLPSRIEGLEDLAQYYEGLRGKIRVARYELLAPMVALIGSAAVLTFNYVSYGGSEDEYRWNCTEVYRQDDQAERGWQIVQTHWSRTGPAG